MFAGMVTAPPPVPITASRAGKEAMTSRSISRNRASPSVLKISGMVRPLCSSAR